MKKVAAIVLAAGKGKRIGGSTSKQWLSLGGKPVVAHALQRFEECKSINAVIVVVQPYEVEYLKDAIIKRFRFKKIIQVVKGGNERQDSVRNALDVIDDAFDTIVVHDGVRPFVSLPIIEKGIESAEKTGASAVCVPLKDTIKEVCSGYAVKTLCREGLWAVQTPQAFKTEIIKHAHKEAARLGIYTTDDSSLVERFGFKVAVIEGSYENIKITTKEDLLIGEAILNRLKVNITKSI